MELSSITVLTVNLSQTEDALLWPSFRSGVPTFICGKQIREWLSIANCVMLDGETEYRQIKYID